MSDYKTIGYVWINKTNNLNGKLELKKLKNIDGDDLIIYLNKNKFKNDENKQPDYHIRIKVNGSE